MLIGNLGKDPEVRTTAGGMTVANFPLATTSKEKDGTGNYKEVTEWHNIVMFGRTAEVARDWLSKGAQIHIEGSIKTEQWQDKEGQTRYTTKIIANNMVMLSSKNQGNAGQGQQQANGGTQAQQSHQARGSNYKAAATNQGQQAGFNWADDDNDLPF